jgi:hypothetical protein
MKTIQLVSDQKSVFKVNDHWKNEEIEKVQYDQEEIFYPEVHLLEVFCIFKHVLLTWSKSQ